MNRFTSREKKTLKPFRAGASFDVSGTSPSERDRRFESLFLQQRVHKLSVPVCAGRRIAFTRAYLDAASGSVAGGLRHRSRSGGRLVERAVHLLERAALGFGAERPMRNKTGQDGGSFPGLLNRYTAKTRIVGSNPIPSATSP